MIQNVIDADAKAYQEQITFTTDDAKAAASGKQNIAHYQGITLNEFFRQQVENDNTIKPSTKRDKLKTLEKLDLFDPNVTYRSIHPKFLHDYETGCTATLPYPNRL